ncbi:MAG: PleD family two-component response regulator [Halioglobus sp.]|jgi:PleD family two-component response regulator
MSISTIPPYELHGPPAGTSLSGDNSIQAEVTASKTKVLIVGNDSAEQLARILTFDSFMQSEIQSDPLRAVAITETDQEIAIIITDLKMPGLDGLQMIRKIRDSCNSNRDLAFIVVIDDEAGNDTIKTLKLGGIDFITTPISPGQLLDAVVSASETRRLRNFKT